MNNNEFTLKEFLNSRTKLNIMKTYIKSINEIVDTPQHLLDFYNDIDEVCKKHNLSISHEDEYGAFEIEKYDEQNIRWLKSAALKDE